MKINKPIKKRKKFKVLFVRPSLFYLLPMICFIFFCSVKIYSQNRNFNKNANSLIKIIQKHHYNPRNIDKELSNLIFDELINKLDRHKILFSKEDYDFLQKYRDHLGSEIINGNNSWFYDLKLRYNNSIKQSDSLLSILELENFDFFSTDSISKESIANFDLSNKLIDKWRKNLKYMALFSFYSNEDTIDFSIDEIQDSLNDIKNSIIEDLKTSFKIKFNNEGGIDTFLESTALKAITNAFDPHSTYFSYVENNNFSILLSKQKSSFGFDIYKNKDDEIAIIQIVPASPAWNSNEINEGDVILSITIGYQHIKNLKQMSLEKATDIILQIEDSEVEFEIRKKDNSIKLVTLKKESLEIEENIIQSFILQGEKKIGYIYLPVFYTEMSDLAIEPKGCADDLAKELLMLQNESIDGLILDLRNNGGGSLIEAIKMVGIFIDYGAIAIIDVRNEDIETIKDHFRGKIFEKTLLVLINNSSASASELFASAMQDHNRAIIVGSNSFGKASGQQIIPVEFDNKKVSASDRNFLKLTTSLIYRVKCDSYQNTGINPDIRLPFLMDSLNINEASYPSAIKPKKINKKTYYFPLDSLPISKLKKLSSERINQNPLFNDIIELSKELKYYEYSQTIPLNASSFLSDYLIKEDIKQFSHDSITNESYIVENPKFMIPVLETMPESKLKTDANVKRKLHKDIHLIESYNIISDIINLTNKKKL